MKIFVIIVTYNGAPWIRGALASLRASIMPCTAVVVDNASGDGTVGIVREEFPEVILLAKDDNSGFGDGNNAGIRLALDEGADYIFLLNQDAFVTPPALGLLVDFLDQHPQYALATPLHCSPNLQTVDPATQRGYLQRYAPGYLSDACLGQVKPFYDIFGINAAAWMVRSSAFGVVGGFDPLFFMYGEDDDLMARFAHHRQRFALVPASRIVHLRARSARAKVAPLRRLWNQSERPRSELLLGMKLPEGRTAGKLLRLLADGVIHPLGRLLVDHQLVEAFSYLLATARVLVQAPTVLRRARQCRIPGAHFLDRGVNTSDPHEAGRIAAVRPCE